MLIFQRDNDIALELSGYYLIVRGISIQNNKSYCYNVIILCEKLNYFKILLNIFKKLL